MIVSPVAPRAAARADALGRALSRREVLLMALAAGLAVAGVYYAQPLLDLIAADFGIAAADVGIVFAVTQLGYGVGLVLLVPLGDMLDRRGLIVAHLSLCAAALGAVALSPSRPLLLAALAAVGAIAVVAQMLVAHAASLTSAASRGGAVGSITAGIITGIVLARVVAGLLADVVGWRWVYAAAGATTAVVAWLVWYVLPSSPRASAQARYAQVVGSVFVLIRTDPVLRSRGALAFLVFSTVTGLWTSMVLELRGSAQSLGHGAIGAFGLSGLLGALGALIAGRLADRGLAQRTTGRGLWLMLAAWLPIALLPLSMFGLIAGALMIDFALQAVHVSNQSLAYGEHEDAKSRLAAAYMLFYALGCASGAVASTFAYVRFGWIGACALGAGTTLIALATWAVTGGCERLSRIKPATAP